MSDKKKILIIDDDPDLVTFMECLLQDNGYDTITANNGKVGADKARAEKPDLVCLDITMPEQSGVKCYRQLREDDELKSIPVVMVTGVMEEFKQFISTRRQVPPPDAYFSKPVDQQELLARLKELLA